MHRLHNYPDVQVMFRRLLIATLIGILAALAVALFRHAMVVLETLFLGNDSGSLVNAAQSLRPAEMTEEENAELLRLLNKLRDALK